jgi:hypothetical protein
MARKAREMSDGTAYPTGQFTPQDRGRIRATVHTVEQQRVARERWLWLRNQVRMWIKWGGSTMGVVAFIIHFWPSIAEIFAVIVRAAK